LSAGALRRAPHRSQVAPTAGRGLRIAGGHHDAQAGGAQVSSAGRVWLDRVGHGDQRRPAAVDRQEHDACALLAQALAGARHEARCRAAFRIRP
jgi:hypothetical protein